MPRSACGHNAVFAVILDLWVGAEQRSSPMLRLIWVLIRALVSAFRSRRDLLLENLVLRQQLAVPEARGKRPRIRAADRAFWLVLRRF